MRDIENIRTQFPTPAATLAAACGGAAVGVHQFDRVEALIEAEVDVLVVDTAHGHSEPTCQTVAPVKERIRHRRDRGQHRDRRMARRT
jgi:IMP dehydrogenase